MRRSGISVRIPTSQPTREPPRRTRSSDILPRSASLSAAGGISVAYVRGDRLPGLRVHDGELALFGAEVAVAWPMEEDADEDPFGDALSGDRRRGVVRGLFVRRSSGS